MHLKNVTKPEEKFKNYKRVCVCLQVYLDFQNLCSHYSLWN